MGYTSSNMSVGLTFQGQQAYSVSNGYEPYGSQLHYDYAMSQPRHALSTGSGAGMGDVGPGHNMNLGTMNMNTNNAVDMGMNMNMNMYTNAIRYMTPGTSPYGDLGGTPFNVQSHVSPPHTLMSHEVRSVVPCSDTAITAGATTASSTRPIAIPVPKHHFRSAPQLALSQSVQSSPPEYPWSAYYYSASPAVSASSMSFQSDEFPHRPLTSQPAPVSPSPSTPEFFPSPASFADKAPAEQSPLLQLVRRKK